MDNGVSSQTSAKILAAIENGLLSPEDTEGRLISLINEEFDREDAPADMELVKACEYLLLSTKSEDTQALVRTILNDGRAAERQKSLSRRIHRNAVSRQLSRIAYVGAAMILCVFSLDMIRLQWLDGRSSDDLQQYVVNGTEINTKLIEEVNADPKNEEYVYTTTDLNEALEKLDFVPVLPQVSADLTVSTYNVSKSLKNTTFGIQYTNQAGIDCLRFEAIYLKEMHEQELAFEQNKEGEVIIVGNTTVYQTKNYDRSACMWSKGPILYTLTSSDTAIELLRIIQLTEGAYENEKFEEN